MRACVCVSSWRQSDFCDVQMTTAAAGGGGGGAAAAGSPLRHRCERGRDACSSA